MISIDIINELIHMGEKIHINSGEPFPYADVSQYITWKTKVLNYISTELGLNNTYVKSVEFALRAKYVSNIQQAIRILNSLVDDCRQGRIESTESIIIDRKTSNPLDNIRAICDRFNFVAKVLRKTHNGKEILAISSEYDVQDLLYALLLLYFDDVRPEECTPSSAGKCSRMDFLIKCEKIVIEVKKTRQGLGDKEIGCQLIEDIARYHSHPDCKTLVCFVYDPDSFIRNPRGLESDLCVKNEHGLSVEVYIRPI